MEPGLQDLNRDTSVEARRSFVDYSASRASVRPGQMKIIPLCSGIWPKSTNSASRSGRNLLRGWNRNISAAGSLQAKSHNHREIEYKQ